MAASGIAKRFGVSGVVACVALVGLLGSASIAFVQTSDANVVNACYQKNDGQLRYVNQAVPCRPSEIPISWNIVGPRGPQGITGPQGPIGPQGPAGPPGASPSSFLYNDFLPSDMTMLDSEPILKTTFTIAETRTMRVYAQAVIFAFVFVRHDVGLEISLEGTSIGASTTPIPELFDGDTPRHHTVSVTRTLQLAPGTYKLEVYARGRALQEGLGRFGLGDIVRGGARFTFLDLELQ
jgi:hypothetical protein